MTSTTFYPHFFKILLISLWSFCFLSLVYAQTDNFDTRYNEAYSLMATDVQAAFIKADSLLQNTREDEKRMKTLMLLANIQHSKGEISSSLYYILKAQNIAKIKGTPDWMARTSGFLATTFRNYGLIEESKKYLIEAEQANEQQKESPAYSLTKINILQEKSFHKIEEDAVEEALSYLNEADALVDKVETTDPRSIVARATVYQLLGTCYLHLRQNQKADSLLRSSLRLLGSQESNLRPYIFRSMANNAMQTGDLDTAWHYLQLAEPYLQMSDREELKINMYESYADYFKAINDTEKVVYYQELLQKTKEQKELSARKIANELIKKMDREKSSAVFGVRLFWVLLACLLIGIGGFVYYFTNRKNQEVTRFRQLLEEMEKKNTEQQSLLKEMQLDSFSLDHSVAADTEKRLLYSLVKLEVENFFLDPDVSVPSLANLLGTNTKYVTFLVRKYRKLDFNDYIQSQRILYILNRLKTEPELLEYKLSYLAEISGFPTHSMFSAAFKSVTGISPSTFIENLQKANKVA